jgi:proteic killer suppression protein
VTCYVTDVIKSFADKRTAAVFRGEPTRGISDRLARSAKRKLDLIHVAARIEDLLSPPGNRLERLKGDRVGQWSIRVNDQWRICFGWEGQNAHAVELVDYH